MRSARIFDVAGKNIRARLNHPPERPTTGRSLCIVRSSWQPCAALERAVAHASFCSLIPGPRPPTGHSAAEEGERVTADGVWLPVHDPEVRQLGLLAIQKVGEGSAVEVAQCDTVPESAGFFLCYFL